MNVLLGPTLSGKTTLMRLMAGLDAPAGGRISVERRDVTGMRVQDRKVAMVYQQFINYPSMTVYENIASPLRLPGVRRPRSTARVRQTADMMRLTPMLDRKPAGAVGRPAAALRAGAGAGQGRGAGAAGRAAGQPRLQAARGVAGRDPPHLRGSGAIFVYATTEPEEALLLGGNTATLWEGRVTQFGPTPQVYRQPADATTARVFQRPADELPALTKAGGTSRFGGGPSARRQGALGGAAGRAAIWPGSAPTIWRLDSLAPDASRFDCAAVRDRNHRVRNLHPSGPRRRALGRAGPRRARSDLGAAR